ncbi:hypothetical protein BD324DRAFT_610112 [Kockovaella imperatae]|uniref:Cation-transporting P-type ATPase C-terminal domain-containing protein n=1 Tax=Kockovaella imperatae TaxID=4999 RepID=A0A1Y1U937_9TREE|nr:hypothetical protein BD324DRAFT_610112 [Kockovaella imperatae]ORX34538.1 hypothetical protein BD324DRAFT_610112 [Kockovaella imperatae]
MPSSDTKIEPDVEKQMFDSPAMVGYRYDRTLTMQDSPEHRGRERQPRTTRLKRHNSISMTRQPQADAPSRVIGEFRTLSMHVDDAKPETRARPDAARDVAELDWHTKTTDEVLNALNALVIHLLRLWLFAPPRIRIVLHRLPSDGFHCRSVAFGCGGARAELNHELTAVGLLSLVDPPREEIPEVVKTLRGAGIRVMMVTGDFALTALAIAEKCGIVSNAPSARHFADLPTSVDGVSASAEGSEKAREGGDHHTVGSLVLSGFDLMQMNDYQWDQACQYEEVVFARTSPEQKLRIVKEFQKRGNTVGMTGDGVNDAPSLKAADIGIAMDCLYLLPAGSFSELMPVLLNVLLGLPQILSNIQVILICTVTDIAPAIALCFEKPESGVMTRQPRDRKKDRLIDWKLLLQAYFFMGVLESLCASGMAFWYLEKKGYKFSEIVLAYGGLPASYNVDDFNEAVNQAQSVQNWWITPAMLVSIVSLFFFSYVPFFQNTFLTRGVPVEHVFIPLTFAIGLLFLDETRKYFVRKHPKGMLARMAW